jgi:ABC-type Fe3+-hydroxamate transport system substrate-binding protein
MYQEGTRVNKKVVAKIFNYKSNDPLFEEKMRRISKTGKMEKVPDFVKMVGNLCDLEERTNHLFDIMTEIIQQNSDRKILILSARLEHLAKFKDYADTFINEMMHQLGFENIVAEKTRYPELSIEEIQNLQAPYILLSSEPFPFKQRHIDELQELCPMSKIIMVDGEIFSWYGSRLLHASTYFHKELVQLL